MTNIFTCPVTLNYQPVIFCRGHEREKKYGWYTKAQSNFLLLCFCLRAANPFIFISALQLPCRSYALGFTILLLLQLFIITYPVLTGLLTFPSSLINHFNLIFLLCLPMVKLCNICLVWFAMLPVLCPLV